MGNRLVIIATAFVVLSAGEEADKPDQQALPPGYDAEQAAVVIRSYFKLLNAGEYAEADKYYGGSYEMFLHWNTDLSDSSDHAVMWRRACEHNGLECRDVKHISEPKQIGPSEYEFRVVFISRTGETFVGGGCLSLRPKVWNPGSTFVYVVFKKDGRFLIDGLPPYRS